MTMSASGSKRLSICAARRSALAEAAVTSASAPPTSGTMIGGCGAMTPKSLRDIVLTSGTSVSYQR
jgi:hypothetical protein